MKFPYIDDIGDDFLPYGELTLGDEHLLTDMALKVKEVFENPVGVELGTFLGRGAVILSKILNKVYTIDVFEYVDNIESIESRMHYKKHMKIVPRTFEMVRNNLCVFQNIIVMCGVSYKQADKFDDDSISLLFMDADHTFNGNKKDFEAFYPKISYGGIIIIHDSGPKAAWMEPKLFASFLSLKKIGESDVATAFIKYEE